MKNKVVIKSQYFDAKATLECGQVFRFKPKESNNGYEVISGSEKCFLCTVNDTTTIETANPEYFHSYFDLDTDYESIVTRLAAFDELKEGLKKGRGIHILKQNLFETIICFIISANNNIPRIQGIVERLAQSYGEKMDGYYAFPTPERLKNATVNDFHLLGAGYRDKYLRDTTQILIETDILKILPSQGYNDALKTLLTLKGVGRKVADCIALFALGHTSCYPTDTWILKADGRAGDTAARVREKGMERYGELAGFAQQFKFYKERN